MKFWQHFQETTSWQVSVLSLADPSYLVHALPYPLVLSCHIPSWLRFYCHSLPCSFLPLPCHAFGLPWSASILATAQVRSYSSLALHLTRSSCPTLASPFQCRADLPWHFPDLSWLCLLLGRLGPPLTLLTLLYPHCSSLTPKSSLNCVWAMPWLF